MNKPLKIKMLVTKPVSPDGITNTTYEKGEEYTARTAQSIRLHQHLIEKKEAEVVTSSASQPGPNKETKTSPPKETKKKTSSKKKSSTKTKE